MPIFVQNYYKNLEYKLVCWNADNWYTINW